MDDLFSDEDEIGDNLLDEDDDIENTQKDDSAAIKAWKAKYVDSFKNQQIKPNFDLDEDGDEDDEEDDEASIDLSNAVQDGDIKLIEPSQEDLAKSYYHKNKKVIFDFYRYAPKELNQKVIAYDEKDNVIIDPKTGEPKMKANPVKTLVKDTYGEETTYFDITLLVNKVFNFVTTPDSYRTSTYKQMGDTMCSVRVFVKDNISYSVITNIDTAKIWGYEYHDKNKGIDIEIQMLSPKSKGIDVSSRNLKLPYHREVLSTNKASNIKTFQNNTFNRTVIFPDPKTLAKQLNLNLGYMNDPDLDYEVVDTENRLIDLVDREISKVTNLAYDAETFGLKTFRWYSKPDLICSHQLTWRDKQAIIIPVRMKDCQNIKPEAANRILKPILENKIILAHNGAADTRFLMPEGIRLNLREDTFLRIRVIIPFMVKASATKTKDGILKRAIDDLVKRMWGWDMLDLHKYVFTPAGIDFDFSLLPYSYLTWYGCPDTDLLWRLWKILRPKLNPEQEHSYRQLVAYARDMAILASYSGIGVDIEGMKNARHSAMEVVDFIKKIIYEFTGESERTLPLSSAKKLSNYIVNKMGVPVSKCKETKGGGVSADKHVMQALAKETNPKPIDYFKRDIKDEDGEIVLKASDLNASRYPFCMLHRKYADLNKDITAFHNRIINNTLEGVYYEFYKIAQTDTYREAGAIQITKKPIKAFLGAYNRNYGFCSMDYNTEEFRIAVNRSTDIKLIQMLRDPESDAHTMVAARMYNKPPSEIDKKLRDPIKTCNFGILYGMKVLRLTKNLKKTEHPTEDDIAEVQGVYDDYTYTYEEMLAPLKEAKDHVAETGWVENDLGYRMIYNQVIDVDDFIGQVFDMDNPHPPTVKLDSVKVKENLGSIMNRAGNYPIQSLAAAQLKDALIRFFDKIVEAGYIDYIFVPLSVHDEIGVIYDKRVVDPYWLFVTIHECFYSEMEYLGKSPDEICPLYIGVGFGTTWGNAKKDEVEFPVGFQNIILKEYKEGKCPKLTSEDDHQLHFYKRIKDYMSHRITELFQDMIDAKEFKRNEMKYRINQNVFMGKKMHELFKTNDEVEDPVTGDKKLVLNLDKYIKIIMDYNGWDINDFTVIDGPEIINEVDKKENIVVFHKDPHPHPIVKQEGKFLTVDIRNVGIPVIRNLANYLRTLNNPERDYHNKIVRFMLSITEYKILEGVKILGVPLDFADKIDAILKGSEVEGVKRFKQLPSPPILYDCDNRFVVFDLRIVRGIMGKPMIQEVSKLLSKYSSVKTANSYEVLYMTGDDQFTRANIFMDGLPINLPDEVKACSNKLGYDY